MSGSSWDLIPGVLDLPGHCETLEQCQQPDQRFHCQRHCQQQIQCMSPTPMMFVFGEHPSCSRTHRVCFRHHESQTTSSVSLHDCLCGSYVLSLAILDPLCRISRWRFQWTSWKRGCMYSIFCVLRQLELGLFFLQQLLPFDDGCFQLGKLALTQMELCRKPAQLYYTGFVELSFLEY